MTLEAFVRVLARRGCTVKPVSGVKMLSAVVGWYVYLYKLRNHNSSEYKAAAVIGRHRGGAL